MKSLKPSMRERKRYLLIIGSNLKEKIEKILFEFVGVLGMAETGLKFIKTSKDSAIIAVNREALNKTRAALTTSAENIKVERVSGTLKGLRK